ncbi:hypothetical protein EG328_011010 [Venturia inaequalis]|uniref:TGS domain-containing protein n=1 Tax=Venturia inaequalis TaxID=5025 RepID=A0A8H3U636_VENIN|nr:hypothetical protein EG328_011010 [Venturia inaequalis]
MPPKRAVEETANNVVAFGRVKNNLKMGCVGLPNVGKFFMSMTPSILHHPERAMQEGSRVIPFSVEFEEKIWSLRDDPEQLSDFYTEIKVKSRISKIVTEGFTKLGLQYYFTAGEKEVRCWVVQKGTLAPQAAGVIHGDFERGFIKAEVVAYQDFHDYCEGGKSLGPIKAAGKFRQEGKTYVVQNGDIIHFQFNVAPPKKK